MTIETAKATLALLTKIKALTAKLVHDAEYWRTSAGKSLNYYNQKQGNDALARKINRLRRLLTKVDALSYSCGDARGVIRQLCNTTLIIIECCQHFPRDREWPGLPHLQEQRALIETAQVISRSFK